MIRHFLMTGGIFAVAAGLIGCETASPGGEEGYFAPQPETPIDRATYMQDRIGQVTRSNVR